MKVFFITAFIFILGKLCFGQEIKCLDEIVEIKLPAGIQKLNSEQIRADFDSTKFMLDLIINNPKNVYKIGNVLITFNGGKKEMPADRLIKNKQASDETGDLIREYSNYKSEIKSINNYDVLIVSCNVNKATRRTSLYLMNHKHNVVLNIGLQYFKTDTAKAEKVAKEILQSIHFKE